MLKSALFIAVLLAALVFPDAAATQSMGSGTLIVANMSDNTATLLDLASGETLATLPTGPAPHEISVSGDGRWAVITNYGDRSRAGNSLTVVDVKAAAVDRTIDLGIYERPHGIAFLPGDSLVAVTSEANEAVLLVNLLTDEIVATIPTNQPASHMLATDAGGRRIFTTNIVAGTITEIDVAGRAPLRTMEVAPFVEGLTMTPDGSQVWVGSNRAKTVSVVDAERGEVVATFEDFGFPYRMAVTPDGALALLVDPAKSEIRLVNVATLTEQRRVSVPAEGVVESAEFPDSASPEGITLSRDGRMAYISLQGRNQVMALDLMTGTISGYLDTGVWPDGIGYSPLTRD